MERADAFSPWHRPQRSSPAFQEPAPGSDPGNPQTRLRGAGTPWGKEERLPCLTPLPTAPVAPGSPGNPGMETRPPPPSEGQSPRMALGTSGTWEGAVHTQPQALAGASHAGSALLGVPRPGWGPRVSPGPGLERSRPHQNGAGAVGLGLMITRAPHTPQNGKGKPREKGNPRLQGAAGAASPSFPPGGAAGGSGGGTRASSPRLGWPQEHPKVLLRVFISGECCQGISRSIPSPPRRRKDTWN